jgi:1-deoxyxylulose-5-phosphate synthase
MLKPRRELGRTGFIATAIGIGDVADRSISIDECARTLRHAIDRGVNVIDTAPSYEDGYSEEIVGQAILGRRDDLFIISKVDHFDRPVRPQVEASMARMDIEYLDAFVFHAVNTLGDLARLTARGGGFAQLDDCISAGMLGFRGISSHHPDVLKAAINDGLCDIAMFPIGPFVDERYVAEILPLAQQRGVGQVCFKTFGAGKLLGDTEGYGRPLNAGGGLPRLSVAECLHYTLTMDPDVALLGLSSTAEMDAAFGALESFRPLSVEAMADMRSRAAAAVEGKGTAWWNPPG